MCKKENALIAVIATVLTASSVIPIWIVRFPPLQDYPVHLLRENIIENYSNPSFQYHSSFVVSLFPIPYIFTDYIVCLLTLVLSIELAGKIMLTSYIVLLPFSAFHLILAVDRNKIPLVLWSYLFIYNRHFTKGNTSYIFSFPFLLIALGYWWKHRARLRWMNVAIFSVLVLCVYLSHLYTFIVLMFSVAVLLFIEFRGIRSPIRTVLPFLPSLILLTISFFLQARQFKAGILPSFGRDPIVIEYPTVKARLKMIVNKNLNMPYLSTFSPWRQKRVLISAAVLFALLLLGSIPTLQKNAFFWLTVALCLLSVVLPSFISPEWDMSLRVLILILLIAPLCLKLPKSPRFRALLVALLSFLSLYTLGGIIKDYLLVSSILQDY
jgi:hypothetical protein